MKTQREKQNAQAVSPVVGVMLMLVVTIIIAAVVSAFPGGLSGTQQKAPTAVLDVHIHALENQGGMPGYGTGFYVPTMTITEVSGDALATKDLKITTTYTNSSETMFAGNLSGEAAVTGESGWNAFGTSQQSGVLVFNDVDRFGYYIVPGYEGSQSGWFGNASAILRPGDILTTAAGSCGNYNDNTGPSSPHDNPGMDYLLGFNVTQQEQVGGFGTGSIVGVKVIHIPSGKMIYNQEVTVE